MAEEKSYERKLLFECPSFEVVEIEWRKSSFALNHSHGWSQCLVLVQDGVFENKLDFGYSQELRCYEVGQVIATPIGAKHEIRCLTETGKTIHVYTPKIEEFLNPEKFDGKMSEALLESLTLGEKLRWDDLQRTLLEIRAQSIPTHSPKFMNQLFSGVSAASLAAEEIISQGRTTLATLEASPVFSKVEREVVEAMGEIIGWHQGSRDGVGVPGGSAANFMALHCARHQKDPKIKTQGMSGSQFRIYVSDGAHYSFAKGAVALGFGSDSVVKVKTDSTGRMIAEEFQKQVQKDKEAGFEPLLVCATAGTTVFGAFDPIEELSKTCKAQNIWLHVDGAWGGPALFSKKLRPLLKGVELSDSVTFDAHKLLGAGLTCSFFLTKHAGLLVGANDVSGGDYIFHSDEIVDLGRLSWQCGRRADALSFWATWKSVGTVGLGDFVDRLLDVKDEAVTWIKNQPRLKLIHEPQFLNVCVKVAAPEGQDAKLWSKIVRTKLIESNSAMVNYSVNQDGTFLRLILANPNLTSRHVIEILEEALDVGVR